jgi:hypothetical protein
MIRFLPVTILAAVLYLGAAGCTQTEAPKAADSSTPIAKDTKPDASKAPPVPKFPKDDKKP